MIHHSLFCCHYRHLVHTHLLLLFLHSLSCVPSFLLVLLVQLLMLSCLLQWVCCQQSSFTDSFLFIFCFFAFAFFECIVVCSACALPGEPPSLRAQVKCEVYSFFGQCKCNRIDSLEVVWLVVIICCGVPVK